MSETYACAVCGGVFEKGWGDDEALAEREQLFPAFQQNDCAIVCDDCFKRMGLLLPDHAGEGREAAMSSTCSQPQRRLYEQLRKAPPVLRNTGAGQAYYFGLENPMAPAPSRAGSPRSLAYAAWKAGRDTALAEREVAERGQ